MSMGRKSRKRQSMPGLSFILLLCVSLTAQPAPAAAAEAPLTAEALLTAEDSLMAAAPVSMEQPTQLYGTLTAGDQTDLYRLDVQKAGTLTYKLKFYLAAVDLRLLNQDGQAVKTWRQQWDADLKQGSETIRFSVEPGIYYIQVKRRSGEGNYVLAQTFAEEKTTEAEPNDTLETAQPLTLGRTAYGVIGVGCEKNIRDKDVYKLKIPAAKNITFTLASKLSGAYLHLYDAKGAEIRYAFGAADKNTGRNQICRTYKLAAGTYYLLVKGGSDTGAYILKAAAAAPPAKTAVSSLTRRGKYQNLQVNLKKVKGAEGYQIYIAANAGFKNAGKYRVSKTSASYHLTKGRTYYVKARAYKKNSEGGYIYSGFSKVKKIKL